MFHVKHYTDISVGIIIYVHGHPNETAQTSYEASEDSAKSGQNSSFGGVFWIFCGVFFGVQEASAVPAGGLGGYVQAGEKASDVAAGRRCALVV